jgi:hypothetical protein
MRASPAKTSYSRIQRGDLLIDDRHHRVEEPRDARIVTNRGQTHKLAQQLVGDPRAHFRASIVEYDRAINRRIMGVQGEYASILEE